MQVCAKISKDTIKFILKIIYKITKHYCMWYQDNFSYQAIDWDHLLDEWNDMCDGAIEEIKDKDELL